MAAAGGLPDEGQRVIEAHDKPRLMPGCRISEAAGQTATLMVPEGAMRLNASAMAIVRLSDGVRTFAGILASLKESFPAATQGRLESETGALLERLRAKGVITW